MKVRNGFVSNSSSSSFCIYGSSYEVESLIQKMKETKFIDENDEEIQERLEEMREEFNWSGLENIMSNKTLLEVYTSDDYVWIGKSWDRINDHETGKEFKERVEQELQDIVGEDVYCTTYTEVIY